MNLSPVLLNDDEEGNVTIELYHTIPLSNDDQNHKSESRTQSNYLSTIVGFLLCCGCCKRGQDFEPLRSNEVRS